MKNQQEWRIELAADAAIVARRTPGPNFVYSVVLLAMRDGEWHAVQTFDNAHEVREHHEHRYVGAERQEAIVSHGPEHAAMGTVLLTLRDNWADIVSEWDQSR